MVKKGFKKSIRYEFLKDISIILFVGTCVLSTVIAFNVGTTLENALTSKGLSFATNIAKRNENALIMNGSTQLGTVYSELITDEEIIYTIIQDNNGKILTTQFESVNFKWPGLKKILPLLSRDSELPDIIETIKKHVAVREISVPIMIGTDVLGKVSIGMSEHNISKQILKTAFFVITLNLIVAIVLGWVLFITSKKTVLDPIVELGHAAARVAKGDLSTHVTVKTMGELQMLVDGFNQMTEDLKKTTVSRDYVDNIIASMLDTLIVVSTEGTIMRLNAAACALLGYAEAELTGRPVDTVIATEQGGAEEILAMLAAEAVGTSERTYRARDGRKIPVLFSASIMHDDNGGAQGIVCVAQDISERKRVERALHLTQFAIDRASIACFWINSDSRFFYVNDQACRSLGRTRDELLSMSVPDIDPYFPAEAWPDIWQRTLQEKVVTFETTHQRKDGTRFPVEITANYTKFEGREYGCTFVLDITERKQAEEKLKAYSEELSEINEELRNFAYIVSHDLRAPLVNIKGFSEELGRSLQEIEPCFRKHLPVLDESEKMKIGPILQQDIPEALTFIRSSVTRMDNLISSILKLSRVGRRKLNPEPLCMRELIHSILNSFAHQIESGHVRVVAKDLPEVIADKTTIEQIVGNLLDNAIKYLEPGRPGEIEVKAEEHGNEVVFHVRDNGRGMAKEDIPKAFEIFRRVGKQDVSGEGMGLAFVKTLVRLQGGRIWCESVPGVGTTFSFTIQRPEKEV